MNGEQFVDGNIKETINRKFPDASTPFYARKREVGELGFNPLAPSVEKKQVAIKALFVFNRLDARPLSNFFEKRR